MHKYHYFGEFGGLVLNVIGGLERFFELNPNKKLEICTYKNYGVLLKHLFPKNVKVISINWSFEDTLRQGHGYWNREFIIKLHGMGYEKNIVALLKTLPKQDQVFIKCFQNFCISLFKIKNLKVSSPKNPIKLGETSSVPKYISIFPRFRKWDKVRNISKEDWQVILEKLKSQYKDYQIVAHGTNSEFVRFNDPEIIYPKNILEQIYYLNNSLACISANSGFAHFATYCGCDLLVLDKSYWEYVDINPFNEKIEITNMQNIKTGVVLGKFMASLIKSKTGRRSLGVPVWIKYKQIKRILGTFLKFYIPKAYYLIHGPNKFDSLTNEIKKQLSAEFNDENL